MHLSNAVSSMVSYKPSYALQLHINRIPSHIRIDCDCCGGLVGSYNVSSDSLIDAAVEHTFNSMERNGILVGRFIQIE